MKESLDNKITRQKYDNVNRQFKNLQKNERITSLYDQIERQCISFERKMKRQLRAFHENVFHIALISTNKTLFNVK